MAKKSMPDISPWTPPPVTREEALTPDYSDTDDGERCLDQLVRELPAHTPTEWEKYQADRDAQKEAIIEDEFQKSRRFEIDIKNKTGGHSED